MMIRSFGLFWGARVVRVFLDESIEWGFLLDFPSTGDKKTGCSWSGFNGRNVFAEGFSLFIWQQLVIGGKALAQG